jgi:hypothetical protein
MIKHKMNNHVWLEKRATASPGLLTPDEEHAKIRALLGEHFLHTGKLFQPDDDFFKLDNDEDLQASARQIFLWLGVKPGHLEIKYGQLEQPGIYTEDPGFKRLIVNSRLVAHPFQCAAVLTHLVMHVVIAGRRRFLLNDPVENEMFINQSIIESGLALAVVNGLAPTHVWQKLRLHNAIDPLLFFPALHRFAQDFASYISNYRLHHEEYAQYLAPWIEHELPPELKLRLTVRNRQATYISSALDERKRTFLKASGLTLAIPILIMAVIFATTRPSAGPTTEQKAQLQKINQLRTAFDTCASSLEDTRRKLDHNDIYQQGIIDGETARCSSLRNEYNSLVDTYNKSLRD